MILLVLVDHVNYIYMRISITEFIDHLELFKAIQSPKQNTWHKEKHLSRVVFAHKNEMIFFSMNLSGWFGCAKEPSH